MTSNYEIDLSNIDGSKMTLDNWKPSERRVTVPSSEWRKQQKNGHNSIQVGLDDIRKIKLYLKRKYPDHEIMEVFGISCEILVAIKRDCYCPIEGISLDNQSKIYKEFTRLDKKFDQCIEAFRFIAENCIDITESDKRMALKRIISGHKKRKRKGGDDEVC